METLVHRQASGSTSNASHPDVGRHVRAHRCATHSTIIALSLVLAACKGTEAPTQPTPPAPTTSRSTVVPTATVGFVEARTSQVVSNGAPPIAVFDDFRLTGASTIRTVSWQGIYCVQAVNAAAPAPTASAFRISFYTDDAGRPNLNTPIQSSTYTLAQVGQTFDKNVSGLTCGTASNTTWPFYRYSTALATPFVATAGARYWISIQALTPSYDVFWGWRDGTPDNASSLQLFQGTYTPFTIDRAYALTP